MKSFKEIEAICYCFPVRAWRGDVPARAEHKRLALLLLFPTNAGSAPRLPALFLLASCTNTPSHPTEPILSLPCPLKHASHLLCFCRRKSVLICALRFHLSAFVHNPIFVFIKEKTIPEGPAWAVRGHTEPDPCASASLPAALRPPLSRAAPHYRLFQHSSSCSVV